VSAGRDHGIGLLLAVVSAFGFSFKAILVKLAYPYGVDAITLLALRMAFALPVFLWVGLVVSRGAPALSGRDWLGVVAMGLAGYYAASVFDFLGLQYISAGLERLILFTYPTLTLIFGMVLARRMASGREFAALALCYVGIGIAFWHDLEFAADATTIWLGSGLVFVSALCYAIYLTGSGRLIARLGTSRFAALATLVSVAAVLGHFLATQPVASLVQPWPVYAYALAMGLFSTALPVFAQSAAIRRLGSARVALVSMLGPLATIGFAGWLLDEPLSLAQLVGAGLVILGVALVSRRNAAVPSASAQGRNAPK
jgi:drug/metabolite transporter (DMT)-like permease